MRTPTQTTKLSTAGVPPLFALAGFVLVCLTAGFVGSFATTPKIPTWYAELTKPSWNPPSWVFGPVWTTLYILMGISGWLVWRKTGGVGGRVFRWFWIQLALNTLWSFLFFAFEQPGLAFVEVVILWAAILATMLEFRKWSTPAVALLAPYLAWVTFAACLNFAIWRLNA